MESSTKVFEQIHCHFNGFLQGYVIIFFQPLSCWARICPAFANSVDPDQLASEEANWSGSALFAIMWIYINNLDQVIWLAEK